MGTTIQSDIIFEQEKDGRIIALFKPKTDIRSKTPNLMLKVEKCTLSDCHIYRPPIEMINLNLQNINDPKLIINQILDLYRVTTGIKEIISKLELPRENELSRFIYPESIYNSTNNSSNNYSSQGSNLPRHIYDHVLPKPYDPPLFGGGNNSYQGGQIKPINLG